MGELHGPDDLIVRSVRLDGAHWVVAVTLGAATAADRGASFFLVTRRSAIVGRGYYRTVEDLADVVDLTELRPE